MPTVAVPTHSKLQNILFATDRSQSRKQFCLMPWTWLDVTVCSVAPFVEAAPPDPEQIKLIAEQQLSALVRAASHDGRA